MNATDVSAVQIAAGMMGTMTLGTVVFLLMQSVKGLAPNLSGRAAEVCVWCVSAFAVALVLVGTRADWWASETWLALVVGTLSATVIARGVYSQLFKVSIPNVPPPSTAEAVVVRKRDARGRWTAKAG